MYLMQRMWIFRLLLLYLRHNLNLSFQTGFTLTCFIEFCLKDLILISEVEISCAVVQRFAHAVVIYYQIHGQFQDQSTMALNINPSLIKRMVSIFPHFKSTASKGESGRMGVIGGSFEFTGAPFYSAISSLRVGVDLSHIFCSKFSSAAIKSYSPQIIVHPLFISQQEFKFSEKQQNVMLDQWSTKIKTWQKAIHSWVVGPGLGRDLYMQKFFPQLVKGLPDGCLVIFDADGIYYLCQHPELFQHLGRFKTILTPNLRELGFLQKHYKINIQNVLSKRKQNQLISVLPPDSSLPPFKLIVKGQFDLILSREASYIVATQGGKKRCGGIGDILAGVTSACGLWDYQYGLPLASHIVRMATKAAFQKQGRGMTAPSVIQQLSKVVKKLQQIY